LPLIGPLASLIDHLVNRHPFGARAAARLRDTPTMDAVLG
jgi:hypothetical protein